MVVTAHRHFAGDHAAPARDAGHDPGRRVDPHADPTRGQQTRRERPCAVPLAQDHQLHRVRHRARDCDADLVPGPERRLDVSRLALGRPRDRAARPDRESRRLGVHPLAQTLRGGRSDPDRRTRGRCDRRADLSVHADGDRELGGRRPEHRARHPRPERQGLHGDDRQLHPRDFSTSGTRTRCSSPSRATGKRPS